MDIKKIQELIKLVTKSGISELTVKNGESEISIKAAGSYVPMMQQAPMQMAQPLTQNTAVETNEPATKAAASDSPTANQFVFKSPMIGTFYRKPSPDKDVFVKVGDTVKNGDTLCIIEAMKLFNEIEFDGGEGKIVKILTDDSSPVEYDQPLFLIEKI
jgi:acetyl-CoA carboxylase biotin carboxyl carrier protein